MHSKYDLVKVISNNEHCRDFQGALGIVTIVHKSIDNENLYELLFVGKHHNELSKRRGIPLFNNTELEGI